MIKVLLVFGTRPEAIKLCPLARQLDSMPREFDVRVCVTAQHRGLLDQVLAAFEVHPHHDLEVMLPGQTLYQSTSRIIAGLEPVLEKERPDMVVVQGDTTTTLCGALAAYYSRIPAGHVEAGLRTGDPYQPFPEELNRVLTTRLSTLHFAPTEKAAANLRAEAAPQESIAVTGNTGIDAALHIAGELESGRLSGGDWPELDPAKKLIVVTAHRRESFGEGLERICIALERIAASPEVQILYAVHPNPNVQATVRRRLGGHPNVLLTEPQEYVRFVDLMRRAYILVTDSGGIQEEGPSLGKPVLVLREKTERPEAVEAGTVRLVGTDPDRIVGETSALLDDTAHYQRMARAHNPYGDGHACPRIAERILRYFRERP